MFVAPPRPRGFVLYCHCAHTRLISLEIRARVLDTLGRGRQTWQAVGDLCLLAAEHDPRLAEWAARPHLTIVACHPRAVRALFAHAGVELPESTAFVDLRTDDAMAARRLASPVPIDASRKCLCQVAEESAHLLLRLEDLPEDAWMPWFPVIDRQRCDDCRACLNFCLFGVYAAEGSAVAVTAPAQCKTSCPACARICPRNAIIFPKHPRAPINGADGSAEPVQVDLSALMTGDLHTRLRARGRFSALTEGEAPDPTGRPSPAELAQQLEIPPEVLERSAGEIHLRLTGARHDPPG